MERPALGGESTVGKELSRYSSKSTFSVVSLVPATERVIASPCTSRANPHRRDAHRERRRFSGQTLGGRYSWARYYHPGLQRFISEDPAGYLGGSSNLYLMLEITRLISLIPAV